MIYTIEISEFAETCIEEIITWYASYELIRRAEKVRDSIYGTIEKISKAPFVFKIYENTDNQRQSLRFAVVKNIHAIVFEIKGSVIVIADVFDLRRDPDLLKKT